MSFMIFVSYVCNCKYRAEDVVPYFTSSRISHVLYLHHRELVHYISCPGRWHERSNPNPPPPSSSPCPNHRWGHRCSILVSGGSRYKAVASRRECGVDMATCGSRRFCRSCLSTVWAARWRLAWVWCGGHPDGPLADIWRWLLIFAFLVSLSHPWILFWRLLGAMIGGGLRTRGYPWPTVASTTSTMLLAHFSFLKVTSRYISSLPDLPISSEKTKASIWVVKHVRKCIHELWYLLC
jgi:hypothetical protein